jgi:hypothetical protein
MSEVTTARNEERALIAKRLYDLELELSIAFGHAYNGDSNTATDQLDGIIERIREMRVGYEHPLSDDQRLEEKP